MEHSALSGSLSPAADLGSSAPQHEDEWMMDDDERQLTNDAEYWERLGSAVCSTAAPSFDAYDLIAEQVEAAFARAADKQHKHVVKPQRPTLRREKKYQGDTDDAVILSAPQSSAGHSGHHAAVPQAAASSRGGSVFTLEPERVIDISQRVLMALDKLPDGAIPQSHHQGLATLSEKELHVLYNAYQHMLTILSRSQRLVRKFGGSGCGVEATPWLIGDDVPQYFANVGGESIFYRKVLSVCGLRNLVLFGQGIYKELLGKHFGGDPELYRGDVGLTKMRRVTGNTVDLDTVVLRCSSHLTLAAINASNRIHGLPQFSCTEDFSSSSQADIIATTCAKVAIDDFISHFCGMTDADQVRRKIHCATQLTSPIPVARDNTTRGKHPVWHYINVGQDSFHANVPCLPDVIGALLRAPFAAIAHYASLFVPGLYSVEGDGASTAADLKRFLTLDTMSATLDSDIANLEHAAVVEMIEGYFEQCVADSCFNGKWKSIEEYGAALQHRGTIDDVLQRLQQQHQHLFTSELFDGDDQEHSQEVAALWSVAQGRRGKGADGRIKAITIHDVQALVKRQADV